MSGLDPLMVAAQLLADGQAYDAESLLDQLGPHREGIEDLPLAAAIQTFRGLIAESRGRFDLAIASHQAALRLLGQESVLGRPASRYRRHRLTNQVLVAHNWFLSGATTKAMESYGVALDTASSPSEQAYIFTHLTALLRFHGTVDPAVNTYRDLLESHQLAPEEQDRSRRRLVRLLLDRNEAEVATAEASRISGSGALRLDRVEHQLLMAELALADGHPARALRLCAQAESESEFDQRRPSLLASRLVECRCRALLEVGRGQEALDHGTGCLDQEHRPPIRAALHHLLFDLNRRLGAYDEAGRQLDSYRAMSEQLHIDPGRIFELHEAMIRDTVDPGLMVELARANRSLVQLDQELQALISLLAHGTRSALGVLSLLFDLPHQGGGGLIDEVRYRAALHRIDHVTAQLLVLAALDQGPGQAPTPTRVDAAGLLADLVADQEAVTRAKGQEVRLTVGDGDLDLVVDRESLAMSLRSALSFASSYSRRQARLSHGLEDDGDRLLFQIMLVGVAPIAPGEIEQAFALTPPARWQPTAGEPGGDIGLHLARELIERLGGTVSVASSTPETTIIQLVVPRQAETPAGPLAVPEADLIACPVQARLVDLVRDDRPAPPSLVEQAHSAGPARALEAEVIQVWQDVRNLPVSCCAHLVGTGPDPDRLEADLASIVGSSVFPDMHPEIRILFHLARAQTLDHRSEGDPAHLEPAYRAYVAALSLAVDYRRPQMLARAVTRAVVLLLRCPDAVQARRLIGSLTDQVWADPRARALLLPDTVLLLHAGLSEVLGSSGDALRRWKRLLRSASARRTLGADYPVCWIGVARALLRHGLTDEALQTLSTFDDGGCGTGAPSAGRDECELVWAEAELQTGDLEGAARRLACLASRGLSAVSRGSLELVSAQLLVAQGAPGAAERLDQIEPGGLPVLSQIEYHRLAGDLATRSGDRSLALDHQDRVRVLDDQRRFDSRTFFRLTTDYHQSLIERDRAMSLAQANQRLNEARTDRRELVSQMAHDVRTALSTLRLCCESGPLPESLRAGGMRAVTQILDLVDRLDQVEEVRAGVGRREVVDLAVVVDQVLEGLAPVVARKGQTVITSLEPTLLAADPVGVNQIVANLVSNASKYSASGTTIRVEVEARPGKPTLRVADEGIGIRAEDLPRFFRRFGRFDSPVGDEPSVGLGLYIADRAARAVGATIGVNSAGRGQGSTFEVTFDGSIPDPVGPDAPLGLPGILTGDRWPPAPG